MTLSSTRHLVIIFSVLVAGLLAVAGFTEKAKVLGKNSVSGLVGAAVQKPDRQKGRKPNRLLGEASPYLQQHAYNPIDWYPWRKEAFAKAKAEKKPIFLSVGYSTCHWCHVMEDESFSQKDIADILNKHFVAIKVDRERRPELDERYMLATQILTGTGGWPNNLFLTPGQKPFFAGGYFSKDEFAKLLLAVSGQWNSENRPALEADGVKISALIEKVMNRQEKAKILDEKAIKKASAKILETFDPFYGGFATAPKFPNEPTLMFLLRRAMRYDDKEARNAVIQTVDAILGGGIHDHVGGGFHRYAVDNAWLTPHFEKMLYNQAQMVLVLVRVYEMTGVEQYKQAAIRTLDFVWRDMTSPDGRFYSAYDADSKGGEGRFYTWSLAEVRAALSPKDAKFAIDVFGVSEAGNFEGYNILHFPGSRKEVMERLKLSGTAFDQRLDTVRSQLLAARNKRQKPHRDKKIVASWNGMMMTAFAEAGRVFGKPHYVRAAEKAFHALYAAQVLTISPGNILRRSSYEGKADLPGQLSDYAALAVAAASLYDALPAYGAQGRQWKKSALFFILHANRLFLDKKHGDYFMTQNHLLKKRDDSAVPSGNAMMLEALAMMAQRTGKLEMKQQADALLSAMSGLMVKQPNAMSYALYASDIYLRGAVGRLSYGAGGHLRASIQPRGKVEDGRAVSYYVVNLVMEKGWHINAHKPLQDDFIATTVSFPKPHPKGIEKKVSYPDPVKKLLGFSGQKMALYEGSVDLGFKTKVLQAYRKVLGSLAYKGITPVTISFQACSDKICLEPESFRLLMDNVTSVNTF